MYFSSREGHEPVLYQWGGAWWWGWWNTTAASISIVLELRHTHPLPSPYGSSGYGGQISNIILSSKVTTRRGVCIGFQQQQQWQNCCFHSSGGQKSDIKVGSVSSKVFSPWQDDGRLRLVSSHNLSSVTSVSTLPLPGGTPVTLHRAHCSDLV